MVSCAIYLEETDRENGCLQVVPDSHRSGDLVQHQSGTGIYAHGAWTEVGEEQAVDVICPPERWSSSPRTSSTAPGPIFSSRTSYRTAWHYIPGDLNLELFPRGSYKDRHIVRGE